MPVVNEGKIELLMHLTHENTPAFKVKLFTDDLTPDHNTVIGDLTEPTFFGYGVTPLYTLGFPTPTINGDDEGETDGPTITWTAAGDPSSPDVIHGIFVTIQRPSQPEFLFWAERFTDPITIALDGDQVQKKLNWFDDNLVP